MIQFVRPQEHMLASLVWTGGVLQTVPPAAAPLRTASVTHPATSLLIDGHGAGGPAPTLGSQTWPTGAAATVLLASARLLNVIAKYPQRNHVQVECGPGSYWFYTK